MTLAQVTGPDLSLSQLSRFERGESDLTVARFLYALHKINVTADEYMDRVHHYKREEQITLMSRMARLHYKHDIRGLEALVEAEVVKFTEDPENKQALLNSILFKGMICDLDQSRQMSLSDLATVSDHLFCTENWTIVELILIGNLIAFYETAFICQIIDEVLKRKPFYQEIATHRNLVEATLLNVMQIMIERGELSLAKSYEARLAPMLDNERNAYHRILYLYFKGFLVYASGEKAGAEEMKKAIQIFDWLESPHHAKTYQDHFDRWIGKNSHI
ncbi:hypothetical protein [Streptococcus plurextorum]|uniref:Rgg family transcriptional regulator n=1 Tax=Streptococcus plurextorum TaxID=456876 RepID=UPI000427D2C9|nr:hypothetical protein [Streptococcus plurextorum]